MVEWKEMPSLQKVRQGTGDDAKVRYREWVPDVVWT
jgi:hypothetical protein